MFFIFGWGLTTKKRLSHQPVMVCEGCHADYLYLTRIREWVTLFFIPVIPYSKKYYYMCKNCKQGYEIDKHETNIDELIEELDAISEED